MKDQKGFTIVELLIVIVIIGILAALVIVAYNGIQNRAKASAQQAAADVLSKKIEAYNSLKSSYLAPASVPNTTPAIVTELDTNKESSLTGTGVTFDGTVFSSSNLPASDNKELNIFRCGTAATDPAPTSLANITATTGIRIGYWNYAASTPVIAYDDLGQVSGTVGTRNVGCVIIPAS